MLVIFEGLDGTGKSSLIKEVARAIPALQTKEPGSPLLSTNKLIREIVLNDKTLSPLQRELLFYADALGHKEMIERQKGLVLSDRGLWSHLAYLYGYMKLALLGDDPDSNYTRYGLCKKLIKECCAIPTAVIYLEGSVTLMKERLQREKDAIESMPTEFFAYVLAGYDDQLIASEFEQKQVLILDAKSSREENLRKSLQFISDLQSRQA